jgi:hypothetical protein
MLMALSLAVPCTRRLQLQVWQDLQIDLVRVAYRAYFENQP